MQSVSVVLLICLALLLIYGYNFTFLPNALYVIFLTCHLILHNHCN